jgi:hypothetical protein
MPLRTLILAAAVAAGPAPALADSMPDTTPNVVVEWAAIVQQAITSPAAPRSAGTSEILHTMVHLAVYDAVVAIEGGSRPFATKIRVTGDAVVRAAVATAAFRTGRPRIAAALLASLVLAYAT